LILESYGEKSASNQGLWRLDSKETADVRNTDLDLVKNSIRTIGNKLGFDVAGEDPITWNKKDTGLRSYYFFAQTTCCLGHLLDDSKRELTVNLPLNILVLPGSRAKLFLYRLERDPRLNDLFMSNWKVMKFRHIRQLSERQDLTVNLWETLLDGDPIRWEESTQLSMFDL